MAIPKSQVHVPPELHDIPQSKIDRIFEPQRVVLSIHGTQDYFISF